MHLQYYLYQKKKMVFARLMQKRVPNQLDSLPVMIHQTHENYVKRSGGGIAMQISIIIMISYEKAFVYS